MDIELTDMLSGRTLRQWKDLLSQCGLHPQGQWEQTALLWEGDNLIATGSRRKNVLGCLAVDQAHQGEDLTARILTVLRQEAFRCGQRHLFLYTKPQNQMLFRSLFFYPVAETPEVLLMEDRADGIKAFLASLPPVAEGNRIGAAVMNCNPFTLGHQYLIETAAKQCDHLYIFVLSEDHPPFPASDRLMLAQQGTAHIPNVTVLPTGSYLISSATFPTYFLKDRDQAESIHCMLDIAVFTKYFAPRFHITTRFVGTEPLSPMTNLYNQALLKYLPQAGIELIEIPRLEQDGSPISASALRALLHTGNAEQIKALVPPTTLDYLQRNHLL